MTGMSRRLLDGARQRHLIARADRNLLARRRGRRSRRGWRAAARLERLRERDRLLDVPAALDPVGAGDAHGDRPVGRKSSAHRIEHFEREAHAVLEAAAIFVVAPVRERRQELVQQIAVRAVELDGIDAEPRGAPRRLGEASRTRASPARSSATGGLLAFGEGDRATAPPSASRSAASGGICPPPFHGTSVDALRPAWASWIAIGMSDQRRTLASVRAIAASVSSDQRPTSP